jgi:hypothetical protein
VRYPKLIKGAQPLPNHLQRADNPKMTDYIVWDECPRRRQIAIATEGWETTAGGKRVSGSHRHPHLVEQCRDVKTLGPH